MIENSKTEVSVEPEISELVPMFLEARVKDVSKLESLAETSNFEEMARICHTIKGIARPYGFPSLEEMAQELEIECKNKNPERAVELLHRMQEFVEIYHAS
jgi:HPt (histidine-containing phosphotransfer) domain-containing protein